MNKLSEAQNMSPSLSGATRIHLIVGDPIVQVKAPAGLTAALAEAGCDAVCVPAHVAPADLRLWWQGVSRGQNLDSIIVTVPHKFASFELCATTSPRAAFLRAVNVARRNADGSWHGDMVDGLGYVRALQAKGCELRGLRTLLVGAGGAGTAIAHALLESGVAELALHDVDLVRRDALIARLGSLGLGQVRPGSADPRGFDLAINATPMGMKLGDPMPLESDHWVAGQWVGCVITEPVVPPMIAAARAAGCHTVTGADMFEQVRDRLLRFLRGESL